MKNLLNLIKNRKQKNKKQTVKEYSKKWLNKWQYFVMFWCSVFFVADIYFNHAEHCVELCVCLVTSICASFVVYLPKAYFGKRNEEENKLIEKLNLNDGLELVDLNEGAEGD